MIRTHASGAGTRWLQRTSEIGKREGRDAVAHSLRHHLIIEGAHRLAQLRKQSALGARLIGSAGGIRRGTSSFVGVGIKSAELTKEDLALPRNAGCLLYFYQLGNLSQLISHRCVGEGSRIARRWN